MSNFVSKKIKSDLKFVYSENSTVSIIFSSNEDLLGVAGEFNNNIKELEKVTKTSIYSRGNSIILKNDQKKIEVGDIEIAPLAFMRGRTLKNSFAILDEAQNATDTQIKMFLTCLLYTSDAADE